eukprot:TRINITY_DN10056_c0_g1_i1.p1 TRINITY_DN10056_c0_g1~~TRINITY_DN10056_c0_g1_i1.p1  ORF type:complete len:174 (-),score=32.83 TRINITY_DN10056_c0_g1_i1:194-670(-)
MYTELDEGNFHLKLIDFGLTIRLKSGEKEVNIGRKSKLPWQWCAPDVLDSGMVSRESDIFSLGVTFWELFGYRLKPFHYHKNGKQRIARPDARLIAGNKFDKEFVKLINWMTLTDKSARPTIEQVLHRLSDLLRNAVIPVESSERKSKDEEVEPPKRR